MPNVAEVDIHFDCELLRHHNIMWQDNDEDSSSEAGVQVEEIWDRCPGRIRRYEAEQFNRRIEEFV
jgi:hypothetical protein